jgi:alanine racemase
VYPIDVICKVVEGTFIQYASASAISDLIFDSRRIQDAGQSLFFALKTTHGDGHRFLSDAFKKGVRNFIVSEQTDIDLSANIIQVNDTLKALQQLAAFHRTHFQIPVIGITGSNGKTIVKEWLHQLLNEDHNIVRSPKSYNSQIGVPLSAWQMNEQHTLAIFEAGISQPGEMDRLQKIIQPTIGVFTNIGEAHNAGFTSLRQKLEEKFRLFRHTQIVIAPEEVARQSDYPGIFFTWGVSSDADLFIQQMDENVTGEEEATFVQALFQQTDLSFKIPFTDEASVQNAITCICVLLHLGYSEAIIRHRLSRLHSIDMRLHFTHGINNCIIINDSYSADLTSLHIALNFLQQQSTGQLRSVILSDFYESGKSDEALYKNIALALKQHKVQKVVAIGEKITAYLPEYLKDISILPFATTDAFINNFRSSSFSHETILIKGARKFEFERVAQLFEQKVHQTLLEINLNAIAHNLKEYQKLLQPATKVMAMVKAFAYGSGGAEIAGILQFNNVDFLGVAYVDEGVELRKANVSLPVMVMNADETTFQALVEYNLQPVIYSFHLFHQFNSFLKDQAVSNHPVHIEIETGMNRLGFSIGDMNRLAEKLSRSSLKVVSVFSHLAASEDALQDEFTLRQYSLFNKAVEELKQFISYPFLRHMANSAAIVRHPQLQLDMVRLGIGLYGVETETHLLDLQPVATLKSTVAQLRYVKAGETVSYNRRGVVKEDAVIATIRIGYADGYSRRFSNGNGKMWINGELAPVMGTVCMDMTMIDVTGIKDIKEGDEVIVFGKELPVQQVAAWIETIPYEIMTSVSQRVKRIYFQE